MLNQPVVSSKIPAIEINQNITDLTVLLEKLRHQLSKLVAQQFARLAASTLGFKFDRVVVLSNVEIFGDDTISHRSVYGVLLYDGDTVVSPDSRSELYADYSCNFPVFENYVHEDVETYIFDSDNTVECPTVIVASSNIL